MEYNKTYSMNINATSIKQVKGKVKKLNKIGKHRVIVTTIKLNKKIRYGDVKVYIIKYHFKKR